MVFEKGVSNDLQESNQLTRKHRGNGCKRVTVWDEEDGEDVKKRKR